LIPFRNLQIIGGNAVKSLEEWDDGIYLLNPHPSRMIGTI